ncbi:MAG: class I SAM-dependent methyltransferase [Desulfovibrio sp.]|uniref:class I SAM-dependent methyltransferase n=1 Tax=Desulfovibrio sp. TaxID=885 RepID=UPI00135D8F99|nr:class I SAM-dependent methyltransferase [Desulfovibrio sp.]MTJ93816.1 class I SAM-dependent methyltransferase [Desulfovibrio sp.]
MFDQDPYLNTLTVDERDTIIRYLTDLYDGVFSPQSIENHFISYVGFESSESLIELLLQQVPEKSKILDIGCGFGTFVLAARAHSYDAFGIEPAAFEVEIARKRLGRLCPTAPAEAVFRIASADEINDDVPTFDAITLWNVVEHIPDTSKLFQKCHSLLKPGGKLFIICPNYFAWRDEAHYHLPWSPVDFCFASRFVNKCVKLGRNPEYFLNGIVTVTNWGVLQMLHRLKFSFMDFSGLNYSVAPRLSVSSICNFARFYFPFKQSICLIATKDS